VNVALYPNPPPPYAACRLDKVPGDGTMTPNGAPEFGAELGEQCGGPNNK